jgi:hypothetical protein
VFRLIFQPDHGEGEGPSRAKLLKSEAYVCLFLIFLLLAFGGIIVYQAPLLTSSDISANLHDKLTVTDNEPDSA